MKVGLFLLRLFLLRASAPFASAVVASAPFASVVVASSLTSGREVSSSWFHVASASRCFGSKV